MASDRPPALTCARTMSLGRHSAVEGDRAPHPLGLSPSRSADQVPDYDFVAEPSQDFFCPVTLELLLHPMLTTCCGHHVSKEATTALLSEKRSCPMCNETAWSAVLDKFHSRRVRELRVRCPHIDGGCAWEGEVSVLERHAESCPRRAWECPYCALKCTYAEGEGKHWPVCSKFPEPCPNGCGVGSVERCRMEQHRKVCSLEPVACEMKEFGCSTIVFREDLAEHMRESQIQHLTTMAIMNLRLTQQLELDAAEKDKKIAQLQQELAQQRQEMGQKMTEQKDLQTEMKTEIVKEKHDTVKEMTELKQIQMEEITKLSEQERKDEELIAKLQKEVKEEMTKLVKQSAVSALHVSQIRQELTDVKLQLEKVQHTTQHIEMHTGGHCAGHTLCKVFVFDQYANHRGKDEEVQSNRFFSHQNGYVFKLCLKYFDTRHNDIGAYLSLLPGENDDRLSWPVKVKLRLELLNQAGDQRHILRMKAFTWERVEEEEFETIDESVAKYPELERKGEGAAYLMNNCLMFRLHLSVHTASLESSIEY